MSKTKIQWTDETWNVTTGCTRVSKGCDNCYAVRMTNRLANIGSTKEKYGGLVNEGKDHFNGKIKLHPEVLEEPLHWQKPRRVFVNSMSDLFHPGVPFEFIDEVFAVMAMAENHTFQVLTKRPDRMSKYLNSNGDESDFNVHTSHRIKWAGVSIDGGRWNNKNNNDWPLSNVWLGTSVENQEAANERIPHLLECPAAVRFLSCEPLLGPVDIARKLTSIPNSFPLHNGANGSVFPDDTEWSASIDWVIVGGESGHNARPMHPDWVRSLRDQCQEADVPFFFKQWGKWKPISEMEQEEHEQYYTPRKKSDNELEQSRLIDLYGQKCSVDTKQIQYDGEEGFRGVDDRASMMMFKIGKKKAGRELDGKEWNQFPEVE